VQVTSISDMTIGVSTQIGKLSLQTWLKVAVSMSVDINFGSPIEVWSSKVSLILLGLSHGIIAVFLSAPSPTHCTREQTKLRLGKRRDHRSGRQGNPVA
jgi:hypothetical protein